MQRIPDDLSIFTAEAKAVDLALDFISTCDANNKFIIFCDHMIVIEPCGVKSVVKNVIFLKKTGIKDKVNHM